MISATVIRSSSNTLPVGFRRPTRDDLPFVFSAWLRAAREFPEFSAVEGGTGEDQHFGGWFRKRIERAIRSSKVEILLAVDLEDPSSLHGFSAVNRARRGLLHWYVKSGFRRMGLGKLLLDTALPAWPNPLRVGYTTTVAARMPSYARQLLYDPSCWEP